MKSCRGRECSSWVMEKILQLASWPENYRRTAEKSERVVSGQREERKQRAPGANR